MANDTNNYANVSAEPKPTFPCPCCGYMIFTDPPGSYDICPICFWEDEAYQLDHPELPDGANEGISLVKAQANFAGFGACSRDSLKHVRKPHSFEVRDPEWRRYDKEIDSKPSTNLSRERYYWRRK